MTENTEQNLDRNNNKDYLQNLFLNIKEAHANQENLTFRIVKPKEKGFTVKVGGLYAFVSFNHMGWSYPSIEYWKNVSNSLVGRYFIGKTHMVKENPILIQIDAKEQIFDQPNLKKFNEYRGVIVQKTNYGVFIDLGLHFNWKLGSILGLIHKTNLANPTDYENWTAGEQITTFFLGLNENEKLVLGDDLERAKWVNGEMDKLIGKTEKVNVVINEYGKSEFYVLGQHKAIIPIRKNYYPNFKSTVKKYLSGLTNGEVIDCEIIKINKKRTRFVLKLIIEPPIN